MSTTTTTPSSSDSSLYWTFYIVYVGDPSREDIFLPSSWPVTYAIWQLENSSFNNGRKLLKGYCCFNTARRLSFLKGLHPTAVWKIRKFTHQYAKNKCTELNYRISGPYTTGFDEDHHYFSDYSLKMKRKQNDITATSADCFLGLSNDDDGYSVTLDSNYPYEKKWTKLVGTDNFFEEWKNCYTRFKKQKK